LRAAEYWGCHNSASWGLVRCGLRRLSNPQHVARCLFTPTNDMQRLTQRLACGKEAAAAFVSLGGQIQYSYVSSDGHPIVAPVIDNCR
jgi:hypothetical protein